MYSFFGIHTFTLFTTVVEHVALSIIDDAKRYRNETDKIKIISSKKYPHSWDIKYHGGKKGIIWRIRYSHEWHGFPIFCIEAIINPRVLSSGIPDYFTVANQKDIRPALSKFDIEARKISDKLGTLSSYKLNRVDYCINFSMKELGVNCTIEYMMALIKRGNVPHHFKERMEYDKISHRWVSDKTSFYLIGKSVVVNCYLKGEQMKNIKQRYLNISDIPDDIIRFEIQCKYNKIFNIKKGRSLSNADVVDILLSDELSREVIKNYYERIIMGGDYYSLVEAIKKIESHHFSEKKEKRLIEVLKEIAVCRGIAKTKAKLNNDGVIIFSRTIRELVDLGINPVTIPREWGIKRIPNLLDATNDIFQSGYTSEQASHRNHNIIKDYDMEKAVLFVG